MNPQKILLIDNYDSFTYNLKHYIDELNHGTCDVFRNDEIPFSNLNQYDAFILSPGPGLPDESGQLMKFVNESLHHRKILGICLGHQALAMSTGGTLRQLENVMHGLQRKCYITPSASNKILNGIPTVFNAGRYHSWVADKLTLPKTWNILAVDEAEEIMMIQHQHYALTGIQFHPESIMTECGKQLLLNWLNN